MSYYVIIIIILNYKSYFAVTISDLSNRFIFARFSNGTSYESEDEMDINRYSLYDAPNSDLTCNDDAVTDICLLSFIEIY